MYGYFVDLRTCGGYFADRRPQLGPQNTHWLVRRSAGPQVRKIPEAVGELVCRRVVRKACEVDLYYLLHQL